jgi:uncharacterized protein YdeI (YjbR/CyaY-like superfamily)
MPIDENNEPLKFFPTQVGFRKWLEKYHDKKEVLWVGYYKKATARQSITWPESVDEALCFGWIDGIRKSIGDEAYKIRFTPRKPTSIWSARNLKRFEAMEKEGKMKSAGRKARTHKQEKHSKRYSYERENVKLSKEYVEAFRAKKKAWKFFSSLPPSVKKPSVWYVMSAKREDTRLRRLDTLISCSEEGKRIPPVRR